MIDTHCHIDLYSNPLEIANECESSGIITIGMTNLPSHFEMGYQHLRSFKKVRLALGLHPLYAPFHNDELPGFIRNIPNTSYIGEVGLDFSSEGQSSKEIQLSSFTRILSELKGLNKILSLHSRKAEKEVLELLIKHKIRYAIFHWYSGPLKLIDEIIKAGYYFSINPAMIKSIQGKKIIDRIPITHLLTESDGPFINFRGKHIKPVDIIHVINYLSKKINVSANSVEQQIEVNFQTLLTNMKGMPLTTNLFQHT